MSTPNYSLPLFEAATAPDLMKVVNGGFGTIDTQLKSLQDAIDALESKGVNTTPTKILSTEDLKGLGITADGIVVNTQPEA